MNITREQFKKLAKKHLIALQGYDVNETIEIFGVGKLYDEIVESEKTDISTEEVTRVEVIDDTGRAYVNRNQDNAVEVQLQDNGRTLKVFIYKKNQEELK